MNPTHAIRGSRWAGLLLVLMLPRPMTARDDLLRPSDGDLRARERETLNELVDALGHPDPIVRSQTIRRLGVLGRPAVERLHEVIAKGSDPLRVRGACLALGTVGDGVSISILDRTLVEEDHEDILRAALLGLLRVEGGPPPDRLKRLRELAEGGGRYGVTQIAALVAGAERVAGLAQTLEVPLLKSKDPEIRVAYVLALAESRDGLAAPLIEKLVRSRERNRLVRTAVYYAVIRLANGPLLEALRKLQPASEETEAFCLAAAAFGADAPVSRMISAFARSREKAPGCLYAFARTGHPEAVELVERALAGGYGPVLQRNAALVMATAADPQPSLHALREMAFAGDPELRSAALLSLAYLRDPVAAATAVEHLPRLREERLLERTILVAARGGAPFAADMIPESRRRGRIHDLVQLLGQIELGRRDTHLLTEWVNGQMIAEGAHFDLQCERLRDRLLFEVLDLDRVEAIDDSSDSGGSDAPGADSGDSGSTGGDEGEGAGGDTGEGGGDAPGGEGGGADAPVPGGVTPPSPRPAPSVQLQRRRGGVDRSSFEADLYYWVRYFPLFPTTCRLEDGG